MKGTTGLDCQYTWFLLSLKKLTKVSLTRFAGHSKSRASGPGMAVAGDLEEEETPRKWNEGGGANGGGLRLRREDMSRVK